MKRINAIVLKIVLCVFIFSFHACDKSGTDDSQGAISVSDVKVSPSTLTMRIGEKLTLLAKVIPENATDKIVKWGSSDPAIVSVGYSTGEIEAIKMGTATIIATTRDGKKTASCAVTVHPDFVVKKIESYTTQPLNAVHFVNQSVGYIAGDYGTMLKTIDGGESWTVLNSVVKKQSLLAVFFTDESTGFFAGRYGPILKTTDGGQTWTKKMEGGNNIWQSLLFLDSQIGFVMGNDVNDPCIMKTTDGGETWRKKTINRAKESIDGFDVYSMSFINHTTGFAVGYTFEYGEDYGLVIKTTDGGETWVEQDFGKMNAELRSVCFPTDKIGYIVGGSYFDQGKEKGIVLKTVDGGNTWTKIIIDSKERLEHVSFVGTEIGYISGLWRKILKTADGGVTWNAVGINDASWLSASWIFDEDSCISVGYDGSIFKLSKFK